MITLLNVNQFVNDIYAFRKEWKEQTGTLVFVKKYDQVCKDLAITNMIPDILNIIMMYVNDEM